MYLWVPAWMVVSRTDIRYSKVTFIVNLRALYVVMFQHNQMIAENRISGVGPIVLILSWGIGGMQGDVGVWWLKYSYSKWRRIRYLSHLFSILRLRGGSTGTTAQGLHMSKSGPGNIRTFQYGLWMLRINDTQKHNVLYTLEINNIVI